jgi:dihydroneopterin aldolase
MDAIQINNIRVYGYTGALLEEQILGQWFTVNLTLWLDLHKAGETDQLTDTLDYQDAIALVKKHEYY